MCNFDKTIDRRGTNAMKVDGFRDYIFHADASMTFPYKDEEFIQMWVADMEFPTADAVIDGIRERLEHPIFGYTKLSSDRYYDALANWCKTRYDWTFKREELVTGNGVVPAIYELVKYICRNDEKVMFFTPSYPYFMYAAQKANKGYVCADLINTDGYYTIDFDDFERKAADAKVTLFILCNPANPSGRVWTPEELRRLAAICEKYDLWIISDEIHCDLLRQGMTHTPMGKIMPDYPKLITCMAASKTFNLAGLMLANIFIRDAGLRNVWREQHYCYDNPLSIAAAQGAYEGGAQWLEKLRAYLDDNFIFMQTYLAEHLPKARFRIPEATYLAWVDVGAYFAADEDLPMFFAYNAGVLLESGVSFVQNADGYVRLNVACPRSMLQEGLRRFCDAVNRKFNGQ